METCKLSLAVRATGPDLRFNLRFNGHTIFDKILNNENQLLIEHDFDDTEGLAHRLEIELSEKLPDHTKLNSAGKIESDRILIISDLSLSGIVIDKLLPELSIYAHDFNGSSQITNDKFYGTMGCNGVATLEFTSPVYMWLLENM